MKQSMEALIHHFKLYTEGFHVPAGEDRYPLVVFQHGFQGLNSHYDEILSHLASHGFVVVEKDLEGYGEGETVSVFLY